MNNDQNILNAIKKYVDRYPQPNLESEAAQQILAGIISDEITNEQEGTYNRDQLNFFTDFDGEEHK